MPNTLALAILEAEEKKRGSDYPLYTVNFPYIVVFQSRVPDSLRSFVRSSFTRVISERFHKKENAFEYCREHNLHIKKFHPERFGKDFYFIHNGCSI